MVFYGGSLPRHLYARLARCLIANDYVFIRDLRARSVYGSPEFFRGTLGSGGRFWLRVNECLRVEGFID